MLLRLLLPTLAMACAGANMMLVYSNHRFVKLKPDTTWTAITSAMTVPLRVRQCEVKATGTT